MLPIDSSGLQKAAMKVDGLRRKVYSALLLFQYYAFVPNLNFPVTIARMKHMFPFRTQK
jgi:hypothetical protein